MVSVPKNEGWKVQIIWIYYIGINCWQIFEGNMQINDIFRDKSFYRQVYFSSFSQFGE